jgi:DNA-binding SARP family transcriptional activator
MLRLKSLGQTLIEVDDARLTPAAETVFATALYLIMEAGRPVGRDELTRLLWPGVSETQAQHGLRQALYKLKTLGATIKADRSALILSPRFCSTDFAPLLAPQSPEALESLASRVGGSFLPGYRPQLSDEFTSWVERQRDVVHSTLARVLVAGIQVKKRVSDWNGAEQLAALCLTMDPLNEEATLTVAEAAALGGSKTKALSILNHYLKDIGEDASAIKLPAVLLRRRISEAYQDNIFPVRDAPFVGREEEMAELTRALARAQSGSGSAYVIWGEPGIGKTRLVQEFTRVAALQRVHIVRVGCQSHDVRRPLSAFVDLVPKLLALPGALGCSPESMQYLRRLTAQNGASQDAFLEARSADGVFEHIQAAISDLVDAIACERCLIIHVEDSQWLDEYSRVVLSFLSRECLQHRSLLLATSTDDLTRNRADNPVVGLERMHLRPLRPDACVQLIARSLEARQSTSKAFHEWCLRSGCGNPLFMLELARHASDDGSFATPTSLDKLIDRRLASLSSLSRRVLQATCVLGRHSTLATIEKILDERRLLLLESLDELEARGFTDQIGEMVTSRHALITTVALSRASDASRALLHRHAALAIEELTPHNTTVLWDCAEHWRQAGENDRAIAMMTRCAQHSLELGFPLESAAMLEGTAALVAGELRATLLRKSAGAYSAAGAFEKAAVQAKLAIDSLQGLDSSPFERAEAELAYLATSLKGNAYSPEVIDRLFQIVASGQAHVSHRLRAALTTLIAADNIRDRELADRTYAALSTFETCAGFCDPMRDHCLLVYHGSFGDEQLAVPAAARLVEYARQTEDYFAGATYLEHSGHAYRLAGVPDVARALFVEAFEYSTRHYVYSRAESAVNALFAIALSAADLKEARSWCDIGREQSTLSKRGTPYKEAASNEAELLVREKRFAEARQLILELRPYSERLSSVRAQARQLALEAHLRLEDEGALSTRECNALLALYPKVCQAFNQDHFVTQLVRGLASAGRSTEAWQIFDQYLHNDRRSRDRISFDLLVMRSAK